MIRAMNRPFDWDGAVLRGVPRRLLIDPKEKERREILKVGKEYCRDVDHDRIKEDGNLSARSDLKYASSPFLEITSNQPFTTDRAMHCCVHVAVKNNLVLPGQMTEAE